MTPQIVAQWCTYLHCRPDGTPFYVGKGRLSRARQLRRSRNRHHQAVVDKYGEANIGVFCFPCTSEVEAMEDEKQQIAQLRKEGYVLCNMTDGGEGFTGGRHSEEYKRRLSDAWRGNQNTKGRTPWNKGVSPSPEQVEKQRAKATGKKHSEETKAKMSAAHIGLNTWSKGRPSPTKGVLHTDETKAKISAKKKGVPWSAARRAAQLRTAK